MALSLSTAPTVEPVTLAEAKTHLRVDHTAQDDYIEDFLIPAARRYAEVYTGRAFLNQTWILRLRGFSEPIVLPWAPLSSVTNIKYLDSAGTEQTWATTNYDVELPSGELALHGAIHLGYGDTFPTTYGIVDDVRITYVAGYGAAATSVPVGIKHGVLMLIEDLYRQPSSALVGAVQSPAALTARHLLDPFRARRFDLRFD